MHHFFIFYAPFIVLGASIAVAFWAGQKDEMLN